LEGRGEVSGSLRQSLRAKGYLDLFCYSREQVQGDWFPPEPGREPRAEKP
jgi:hypothetical protein